MHETIKWLCRVAPSLGTFEDDPNNIWGTKLYTTEVNPHLGMADDLKVVFFGLYGFKDFYQLWRHKGRKAILWAGSDIRHFKNGYWLDEEGGIRLDPHALAEWINIYCESWVENEVERGALEEFGIKSKVCPSFLGKIEDYGVSFKPSKRPSLYTSVSGDDYALYGWDKVAELALRNPDIDFHLYGNTKPYMIAKNGTPLSNVFVHGRVPKEVMNAEIKDMTGALRMTEFDGFSEIIAKSILWGQYPISLIPYPHILTPTQIDVIKFATEPNLEGRDYYRNILNKYPWNNND